MDESTALKAIEEGRSWAEFCETLKQAGEVILRERSPSNAFDRAEGFRYLSRLTRLALEKYVEHGDPLTPRFYALSHETAKIGIDNPDSYYMNATISGKHEYRVSGTRGNVAYLGFGAYRGDYSSGGTGCTGSIEGDQLEIGPDGRFEIILSCRERPGNWLRMEPETAMLIVRQNRLDREGEELAQIQIERIGAEGPPAPLDPGRFGVTLDEAARYVMGTATYFTDWVEEWTAHPNELPLFDHDRYVAAHGHPDIYFYMGYWELRPDEALLVEATPPECDYWNFQLCNYWLESLDYRYRPVHYNKHTTTYEPDGSFRLVVAHSDPGVPNWVDTEGHARGSMGLRWVKASHLPDPQTRVVKFDEISR